MGILPSNCWGFPVFFPIMTNSMIVASCCIPSYEWCYFRTIYIKDRKKNMRNHNLQFTSPWFCNWLSSYHVRWALFLVTILVAHRSQRTDPIVKPRFMTQLFGISKKSLKIVFKISTNSTFKHSRYYLWICVVRTSYKYSNVIHVVTTLQDISNIW